MTSGMTNAPTGGQGAVVKCGSFARQRIAAARRMEPRACGCRDPWLCQCRQTNVIRPDAILAAHRHLAALGLTERRTN